VQYARDRGRRISLGMTGRLPSCFSVFLLTTFKTKKVAVAVSLSMTASELYGLFGLLKQNALLASVKLKSFPSHKGPYGVTVALSQTPTEAASPRTPGQCVARVPVYRTITF